MAGAIASTPPRPSSRKRVASLAARLSWLLAAVTVGQARAGATGASLMHAIATSQQRGHRAFVIDVAQALTGYSESTRRILGVSSGDEAATRILYVFTYPRSARGSTLLIHHDTKRGDERMWLHLPSLDTFREVETERRAVLVPGTGLSYTDARGWIDPDAYDFDVLSESDDETTLRGTPRPESSERGHDDVIIVRADPRRRVVTGVVYHDRAGEAKKTYEATAFTKLGERWLPTHVTTWNRRERLTARIVYSYVPLDDEPHEALFAPSLGGDVSFLERLAAWRSVTGLEAELADSLAAPGRAIAAPDEATPGAPAELSRGSSPAP